MRHVRSLSLISFALAASSWSCSGSVHDAGFNDPADTQSPSQSLMRQAQSCQDLDQALKDDMRARLRAIMQQQALQPDTPVPGGGGMGQGEVDGGAPSGEPGAAGSSMAGQGGGNSAPPSGSGESNYTGTNTQVAGVDEADFVKTDGSRLFVLRQGQLHVAASWPAAQMSVQSSVEVEGVPFEMYLVGQAGSRDQRVVVYSTVEGTPIYEQAGIEPPDQGDVIYPEQPPGTGAMPQGGALLTKVTVLSVSSGAPEVERELYLDGTYTSSRRNGARIRTVLQTAHRGPQFRTVPTDADVQKAEMLVIERLLQLGQSVEDIASEELDRMVREALGDVMVSENELVISQMSYKDWLPIVFTKAHGAISASTVACESFFIPKAGTSQLGVTHVMPLDLNDPASVSTGAAIVGRADTMYENAQSMILASNAHEPADNGAWDWNTYLHSFDVSSGAAPAYLASGVVPGRIYGQFAIDERNGTVRVVTTTGQQWTTQETANYLTVLQATDQRLAPIGQLGPLAQGEDVYAVRFVGDMAYIVTFRQTDPLFVVDLTVPTHPTLLGELHIPGFSEYMHPLDDNHLLTVGRDGDAFNVALQIFDVTDRIDPQLAHKYVFNAAGVTEAATSHKAVTYYAERGLLALPFADHSYDSNSGGYRTRSSLELFRVSHEQGFAYLGHIDGAPLLTDAEKDPAYMCYPPYGYGQIGSEFRRGLFRDDVLFAVAHDGIVAANVNNVAAPIATLRLNDPAEVPSWCMPGYGQGGAGGWDGGDWDGGTAGAAGGPWDGGAAGAAGGDWDGGPAGAGGDWDAGPAPTDAGLYDSGPATDAGIAADADAS